MKILCACAQGIVRSATTRIVLNSRKEGHDVLVVGVKAQQRETLELLARWADKILVAEEYMTGYFPVDSQYKVEKNFSIGPDVWHQFNHPELVTIIQDKLRSIGL